MGRGVVARSDGGWAASTLCAPDATSRALPLAVALLWSPPGAVRGLGLIVGSIGCALAVWSLAVLGGGRFFGRAAGPARFVLRGPYKWVRHPFYGGALTCVLGLFAVFPSVAVGALIGLSVAAVAVAIPMEERRLVERFGDAYRRYRAAVPCLLPVRSRHRRTLA